MVALVFLASLFLVWSLVEWGLLYWVRKQTVSNPPLELPSRLETEEETVDDFVPEEWLRQLEQTDGPDYLPNGSPRDKAEWLQIVAEAKAKVRPHVEEQSAVAEGMTDDSVFFYVFRAYFDAIADLDQGDITKIADLALGVAAMQEQLRELYENGVQFR